MRVRTTRRKTSSPACDASRRKRAKRRAAHDVSGGPLARLHRMRRFPGRARRGAGGRTASSDVVCSRPSAGGHAMCGHRALAPISQTWIHIPSPWIHIPSRRGPPLLGPTGCAPSRSPDATGRAPDSRGLSSRPSVSGHAVCGHRAGADQSGRGSTSHPVGDHPIPLGTALAWIHRLRALSLSRRHGPCARQPGAAP